MSQARRGRDQDPTPMHQQFLRRSQIVLPICLEMYCVYGLLSYGSWSLRESVHNNNMLNPNMNIRTHKHNQPTINDIHIISHKTEHNQVRLNRTTTTVIALTKKAGTPILFKHNM